MIDGPLWEVSWYSGALDWGMLEPCSRQVHATDGIRQYGPVVR